jgi:hypothetical protein
VVVVVVVVAVIVIVVVVVVVVSVKVKVTQSLNSPVDFRRLMFPNFMIIGAGKW